MKYVVTVIRDGAADVFGVPMFLGSVGQAIRSFSDEVQRDADTNMLNKHPEDFDLYLIGRYDDATATFEPEVQRVLIRARDCVGISK